MSKFISTVLSAGLMLSVISIGNTTFADDHVVKPQKMSKSDISGDIFSRPDTIKKDSTLDVTSLLSSDEKFSTGMYKSGPKRFEITEPYGVDEFMFFLEGSVKLTSSDGSVQTINAGEAVSIPKEWTGIWETEGYRKIWVIYSATGNIE